MVVHRHLRTMRFWGDFVLGAASRGGAVPSTPFLHGVSLFPTDFTFYDSL
jgi:hypothetical protein